jgi:hypothetical protein
VASVINRMAETAIPIVQVYAEEIALLFLLGVRITSGQCKAFN